MRLPQRRSEAPARVTTRAALATDADAIASLLLTSFREFEPLYTTRAFHATTPGSEEIRRRLGEGPTWVAELERAIVGTVSAVPMANDLYVRSMAVDPAARGRGIGQRLLDVVEAYASARRCARLLLRTTPFLTAAIGLYERAGFRRADEGPPDLLGTPIFTMTKDLRR